jgi:hypothetical protein
MQEIEKMQYDSPQIIDGRTSSNPTRTTNSHLKRY